jgi:hypothetical protein
MPYRVSPFRKHCQDSVLLDPEFECFRRSLYMFKDGYPGLCIEGKDIPLHRHIMEMVYKFPASGLVDHVNRNTLDNRLCNLRFASKSENQRNHGPCKPYLNRATNKYYAQARTNRGRVSLGFFKTQGEAAKVLHSYHKFRSDMEDLKFFMLLLNQKITIPPNSYYSSMKAERQG